MWGSRADFDSFSGRRPRNPRAVKDGGVEHGVDLGLLLKDRLQQGHVHSGVIVIGVGASRDLVDSAAENEGIEQLIGNELAGTMVILGPPGGGNLGAQLRVEAGALQRDVAQHRDHVDHEGLALRPIQGLPPAVVEQTQ